MTRINLLQNVSVENTQGYIDSFTQADTDGNGFLDSRELRVAFGRRDANRMLKHADYFTGNSIADYDPLSGLPIYREQPDKKLSLPEFLAHKIDSETNGDHNNHSVFKDKKDDKDYMKLLIRRLDNSIYLFDYYDADENGIVEPPDLLNYGAQAQVIMEEGDINDDGKITLAEQITHDINNEIDHLNNQFEGFDTVDTNHNGELSKRELGELFDKLDINHDGVLTVEEAAQNHWNGGIYPTLVWEADSKKEFISAALEHYDYYRNNRISTGEFIGLWYGTRPGE